MIKIVIKILILFSVLHTFLQGCMLSYIIKNIAPLFVPTLPINIISSNLIFKYDFKKLL